MPIFELIVSSDGKSATLYMPLVDRSFSFYDSYGTVTLLVYDFLNLI